MVSGETNPRLGVGSGAWRTACRFAVLLGAFLFLLSLTPASAQTRQTPLDRYVAQPDPAYRWKIVARHRDKDLSVYVVNMVSQTWRTKKEVDRTEWVHWMVILIPDEVAFDTGLLFIGGGDNGGEPPKGAYGALHEIARRTKAVVAEVKMVPNQPLVFHEDGKKRYEDDLIAYTWVQFLKTGDPSWPARNAMVKSAVRAMDTVTALAASESAGRHKVDKFVVAGGSKRGWTTWLTAAVDPRVVAIAPIVIDVLNMQESMKHHFAAYGFWSPAVGDYVRANVFDWFGTVELAALQRLVDPYFYRDRLDMPKYIMNASGDQFFLPDSSQFYFDRLSPPKALRYYPNADHGLKGTVAPQDLLVFFATVLRKIPRPTIAWTFKGPGGMAVRASAKPSKVLLWQATNPQARDFRKATFGPNFRSAEVPPDQDGVYRAEIPRPPKGWTAYFMEFRFDIGIGLPYHVTTPVRVTPDVLPHADRSFFTAGAGKVGTREQPSGTSQEKRGSRQQPKDADASQSETRRGVPQRIGVIFDTDIGNDVDDVLALAMIHALETRGHCKLLAVTSTKTNPLSAAFIDLINTFYGRTGIPVGLVRGGATPAAGKFLPMAAERRNGRFRYPHRLASGKEASDATRLLRETLTRQPDDSVVIIQVGFSTNLARLIESSGDDISPLDGRRLMANKVRFVSVMAGSFRPIPRHARHIEYNVVQDKAAFATLIEKCPVPIVFSGYEIGISVRYPRQSIERDYGYVADHPVAEAYRRYCRPDEDRPTWDLTSVLYGILPDRGYFSRSPPGTVHMMPDGYVWFEETKSGKHYYLILSAVQRAKVREALVQLSSQPPLRERPSR